MGAYRVAVVIRARGRPGYSRRAFGARGVAQHPEIAVGRVGLHGFRVAAVAGLVVLCWLPACSPQPIDLSGPTAEWPEYGGDKGGMRFSPLTQITPDNVDDLEVAWVYHHGDISDGSDGTTRTSFNATPILARRRIALFLHGLQPGDRTSTRKPETERWAFDPIQMRLTRNSKGPYTRTPAAESPTGPIRTLRPKGALQRAHLHRHASIRS